MSRSSMTIPLPTRAFVETRGGTYGSLFHWPLQDQEFDDYMNWKTPKGQMRHESHIQGMIVVYSLPVSRWIDMGPEGPATARGKYDEDGRVTSQSHFRDKSKNRRKAKAGKK